MTLKSISRQQVDARWDLLPDALREALVSEETTIALKHIYDAEHIPEETRRGMNAIVGLAFMGFVHPEEIAEEMKAATAVPPQTATNVSSAIASRILSRYKVELEKIYTPTSGPHSGIPTLIQSSSEKPVGAVGFVQAPRPAGAPFASAMSGMPAPKPVPAGTTSGATPQAVPMPAPVMLHREAEFRPIQQGSSSLRGDILGKPPAGTGATSMFGNRPTTATPQGPVAAKIEFSGSEMMKSQTPIVSRTEASIPRVVHYSEMKTPVSPFGAAEAGAVRAPQAPPLPQAPQNQAPTVKPAMPPSAPTAPPPRPAPSAPPRPVAPAAPPIAAQKEVNYTQTPPTPPTPVATPKPTPPVAPAGMMTDLKKIMSAMPPSPIPPRPAEQPPAPTPTVPKPPNA